MYHPLISSYVIESSCLSRSISPNVFLNFLNVRVTDSRTLYFIYLSLEYSLEYFELHMNERLGDSLCLYTCSCLAIMPLLQGIQRCYKLSLAGTPPLKYHLGDKGKYCLAALGLRHSPLQPMHLSLSDMWAHRQQTSRGVPGPRLVSGLYLQWPKPVCSAVSAVPVPHVLHVLTASVAPLRYWKQASGSPNRKGCLPRVSRIHISPKKSFP